MLEADLPELGVVKPAKTCSVKWWQMTGAARVRQCATCRRQVFNFAEISSLEARRLFPGHVVFKRFDGTVLTRDCPRGYHRGWTVARRWLPRVGVLLAVLFVLALGAITLFGDEIRCAMGMCEPGFAGYDPVEVRSADGRRVPNSLAGADWVVGPPARR